MTTLITILIVLAAIVMILVVLVQKSKGGGLSSGFSSSNSVMGVRKTTDFLEKATWGLACFMMIMSIVCVRVLLDEKGSGVAQPAVGAPVMPTSTPDLSTTLPGQQPAAPAQPQPTTPEAAQ